MTKRPRETEGVTDSGRWFYRAGKYGCAVTVRESEIGGPLVLDYTEPGTGRRVQRQAESSTSVRNTRGGIDSKARRVLVQEADALSATLHVERLSMLREDVKPTRLTVAQAFALYHDEEKGGLPESKAARVHHASARAFWTEKLGGDTAWNRVTPADVEGVAMKLGRSGKVQTADKYVRCLRTVRNWLAKRKKIAGLADPTEGFPFDALRKDYTPKRPRYTAKELSALLKVAHEVDPRFRFALIWADDSGARSAALYRAMRSQVDEPLEIPPPPGTAPYGWANLPAMKGQGRALTHLTLRQRIEFVRATWKRWNGVRWVPGYLSHLEARYRAEGIDYPLIPGGPWPRGGIFRTLSPIVGNNTLIKWLREAEEKAGVPYVPRRGFHGMRRAWADWTHLTEGMDVTVAAGSWANADIVRESYALAQKHEHLERSRRAQERKER